VPVMTDFAELGLVRRVSSGDNPADDLAGVMGMSQPLPAIGKPLLEPAISKQRILPGAGWKFSRATSAASRTSSCDTTDVQTFDDDFEATLRSVECDSALLLRLRVSAPSVSDWYRNQMEAISTSIAAGDSLPAFFLESSGAPTMDSARLNSSVWTAMGRRFSVVARENSHPVDPLRLGNS